ncbi:GNAT family N-acetyltransferase [Bacillus sp. MUM 13]|uniref:GNAT family N-acetyltransferase n=1 Tax=Bacillus sp. MUM 13 TaxID=1678001 RepID=UPI0008F5E98C|nr:GNAT family N-acetyltransferase [Bacillus sp. MUM 13]OIK13638.1 GNAT family N-acetyltransferase [Bacillus sp. MUM 13]
MNAILREFPEKIETDRLYIRPCQPGDGQAVHAAITASLSELAPWLAFATRFQTLEETEENVIKSYAQFLLKEDIRLHIYRKEDHVFIGSTGLHRINWQLPKFEIGYWIDSRYGKKGYMTEAAEALTAFAFDYYGANRVEIRCDPNNISSRRIAEKLGYPLEGILRNEGLTADGKNLRDTCIYAKTQK